MIEFADAHDDGEQWNASICIVGGGAAGISLAVSLIDTGINVLLLEAGKEEEDPATQSLYEGAVADERMHSPPDKYRQRRWGGSTTIWGGRCMPLDPIDFEPRPHIPNSGWPIRFDDLAPYYPEANRLVEAGAFQYDAKTAFDPPAPPMIEGFASQKISTDGLERFSCPTDMGRRYRARLDVAPNIRVMIGANCTKLRLSPDGGTVVGADIATLTGKRFTVTATTFVLAMGGLETTRLLLSSNDVAKSGIGNEHDVLGRYYMCHVAGNVGALELQGQPSQVRHGYEVSPDGVYCRRRLQLKPDVQKELGVCNLVARLHFPKITDPAHQNGVLSGLFVARHFISYEYGKRLKDPNAKGLWNEVRHLWNIATHPWDAISFITHWIRKRTLADRKFPSIILSNRTNRFSLEIHAEQIPTPESKVTLIDEVDRLGVPKIKVDWRYTKEDIEMVRATLKVFAQEFASSSVGSFHFDDETLEDDLMRYGAYGGHHLGTARMGADPQNSVVDANCKVHSVGNLYVASGAVFPTSSQANPTLTIVALALRLSHHLQQRFSAGDHTANLSKAAA